MTPLRRSPELMPSGHCVLPAGVRAALIVTAWLISMPHAELLPLRSGICLPADGVSPRTDPSLSQAFRLAGGWG